MQVAADESASFSLEVQRQPTALDDVYRPLQLEIEAALLAEGGSVPFPPKTAAVPFDVSTLPAPPEPATEFALQLDGDGFARVTNEDLNLPDGPFTVECWMRAHQYRSRQGLINKTENSGFGFFVNHGVPEFMVHLAGRYVSAKADSITLDTQKWYHLAGVFDGQEVRLYVDGKLAAKNQGAGARTRRNLPLIIGADVDGQGNGTSHFDGYIDEVRVTADARYEETEFVPQRRFTPDDSTILLLHMDGTRGEWIFDSSARQRHPQLLGEARTAAAP